MKKNFMAASSDFSCEIMALVALMILSALSHFWYIMIFICVLAVLAGVSSLLSRIVFLAGKGILERLPDPARPAEMRLAVEPIASEPVHPCPARWK